MLWGLFFLVILLLEIVREAGMENNYIFGATVEEINAICQTYRSRDIYEQDDLVHKTIDVLVDGPFVEEKKNLSLRFRGSENQRLIHVPASLAAGKVVLWEDWQGEKKGMTL